jgi:hypothetical protein
MKFLLLSAALVGVAAASGACDQYSDVVNNANVHYAPSLRTIGNPPHDYNVCGVSFCANPAIPSDHWWSVAEGMCYSIGMRLPTIYELKQGGAVGTGCGADSHNVWSSTPCDEVNHGHWAYRATDRESICVYDPATQTPNHREMIRCVAQDTATPTDAPTAAPTAAPSSAPTAAPTAAPSEPDAQGNFDDSASFGWVVGLVNDTVWRCNDYCLTNDGSTWELADIASQPAGLEPLAEGWTAETTTATWSTTQQADVLHQTMKDGNSEYVWPMECACAQDNLDEGVMG